MHDIACKYGVYIHSYDCPSPSQRSGTGIPACLHVWCMSRRRWRRQRRHTRGRAIFIFANTFCQNVLSLQIKANLSHACTHAHTRARGAARRVRRSLMACVSCARACCCAPVMESINIWHACVRVHAWAERGRHACARSKVKARVRPPQVRLCTQNGAMGNASRSRVRVP